VHEVGHQAAALLGLVESLRLEVQRARRGAPAAERVAWLLWERWVSEIVADLYSIARVGVSSTMGLIGLVSLPRAFVFRIAADDPHPFAWIRVQLSCAFGDALYPHPQWRQLALLWSSFYPPRGLGAGRIGVIGALLATMPSYVRLVLDHRPASLRGHTVGEVFRTADRSPARLARRYAAWQASPSAIRRTRPALAFAVVGQARADGLLTPEAEDRLLGWLISYWALRSTLDVNAQITDLSGGLPLVPAAGRLGAAGLGGRAPARLGRTAPRPVPAAVTWPAATPLAARAGWHRPVHRTPNHEMRSHPRWSR
jgi:hypothetical protein